MRHRRWCATGVGRIEFDQGKPTAICSSDTTITEEAAALPYGSAAGGNTGIRCLSEQIEVTCVDASQRGFFLARGVCLLF